MKKLEPKLSLSRQTLRLLVAEKLVDVRGGLFDDSCCSMRPSGCSTLYDSRCCTLSDFVD